MLVPTAAPTFVPVAPATCSTRTCCAGSPRATTSASCSAAWARYGPSSSQLPPGWPPCAGPSPSYRSQDALEAMPIGSDRPELFTAADLAFHAAVLRAAGNELLEQMESVIAVALSVRDRFVYSRRGWDDSIPVHRELFGAIARQDPGAAVEASPKLLAMSATDLQAVGVDA